MVVSRITCPCHNSSDDMPLSSSALPRSIMPTHRRGVFVCLNSYPNNPKSCSVNTSVLQRLSHVCFLFRTHCRMVRATTLTVRVQSRNLAAYRANRKHTFREPLAAFQRRVTKPSFSITTRSGSTYRTRKAPSGKHSSTKSRNGSAHPITSQRRTRGDKTESNDE